MGYLRKFPALLFYLLATNLGTQVGAVYSLVREYSGASFFDRWDFYGNIDDTTWGKWLTGLPKFDTNPLIRRKRDLLGPPRCHVQGTYICKFRRERHHAS